MKDWYAQIEGIQEVRITRGDDQIGDRYLIKDTCKVRCKKLVLEWIYIGDI